MKHESCQGCRHDLGGGSCKINMEAECREGGGFELWEESKDEPVRRGQWVNIQRPGASLWCSECKSHSPWDARHNYCPNCGAKMDKEGEQ